MRRALGALAAVGLAAGLSACGTSGAEPESEPAAATVEETDTAVEVEEVEKVEAIEPTETVQSDLMKELESRGALIDCTDRDPVECQKFKAASGLYAGQAWVLGRAQQNAEDGFVSQDALDDALVEFLPMVTMFQGVSATDLVGMAQGICEGITPGTDLADVAVQLIDENSWTPEEAGFVMGTTTAARCPETAGDSD